MIALIKFLIFGHLHKWEIIQTRRCDDDSGGAWTRHYCQCKECGKIKVFDPD